MKLKKLALCVAVATGAATTAQAADTLFFPYIVSGDAVLTLVSVINAEPYSGYGAEYYNFNGTDYGNYSSTAYKYLHWRYHVKTANTADAECLDVNGYFPTSPLDITTYNVSGQGGVVLNGQPTGVMFNDPSVNNNWASATVSNQNRWNAITLSGQRGILFVHNAASTDGPFLAGEALVFEFGTGAAWGYRADVNSNTGPSADADFDFSGIGPIGSFVSLMPADEVVTRFFITPVNDPNVDQEDGEATNWILFGGGVSTLWYGKLQTEIDLAEFGNAFKVWDRDEGGLSGGVEPKIVTCVWAVNAVGDAGGDGLIVGSAQRAYVDTQGGWAALISRRPLGVQYPTENAAAIKLEFRPAGITGGSLPSTLGAANNAYRLNPYVQAVDNTAP